VLAADQFIVNRPLEHGEPGKTILAGYPWYDDWGRHAMISLPGLTLTTGRFDVARSLLLTFAHYLDQGMIPNVFPDLGDTPAYNSVDASLWFIEAVHAYHKTTGDDSVLAELFPALAAIIDSYRYGTRYTIQLDPNDGLLYAGETGLQLTWMDAKISEWVVTPRTGKPIEVNALWYNALRVMAQIAQRLGKPDDDYTSLAEQTAQGFDRFWNPDTDYCFDVLDGPSGNDPTLRPNQILAVSLPEDPDIAPLLTADQRKAIVDCCSQTLLTSYGLRSLPTDHPNYRGRYEGDQVQRDMACHQGTVWGWLIGPFVQSHLKVYGNSAIARSFLEPMSAHLQSSCVGSLSEMFDGDAPLHPRGAFAHAGTVAEVLRTWMAIAQYETR
jgi:predicted glycogen debranching enzyme